MYGIVQSFEFDESLGFESAEFSEALSAAIKKNETFLDNNLTCDIYDFRN